LWSRQEVLIGAPLVRPLTDRCKTYIDERKCSVLTNSLWSQWEKCFWNEL